MAEGGTMLRDAILHDLSLASEALKSEHPMSSYRLTQLAAIIADDYEMCWEIIYRMQEMQSAVEEIHSRLEVARAPNCEEL